jgi:hypothetical protein
MIYPEGNGIMEATQQVVMDIKTLQLQKYIQEI